MTPLLDAFLRKKPAPGTPAKIVCELTPQERADLKALAEKYVQVAAYYLAHKVNVQGRRG